MNECGEGEGAGEKGMKVKLTLFLANDCESFRCSPLLMGDSCHRRNFGRIGSCHGFCVRKLMRVRDGG